MSKSPKAAHSKQQPGAPGSLRMGAAVSRPRWARRANKGSKTKGKEASAASTQPTR